MRTIIQSVEDILRQSPFLSEALSEGIVNYSAVARKLRPDLEKIHLRPFTEGAIIMALRKLEKLTKAARSGTHVAETVRSIMVHSNLVQYAFKNSPSLQRVQEKLLQRAEKDENVAVYFARGLVDTGIIVSDTLEEELRHLTKEESLIKKYGDLSGISVRFLPDITHIPGVYYTLFKALAWKGINIVQIVSGFAELTFLFDGTEVDRAFSAIKVLTDKKKPERS